MKPNSIDLPAFMAEHLQRAEPDLLRSMLSTFVQALMSAEADAICGAGYGERRLHRVRCRVSGPHTGTGSHSESIACKTPPQTVAALLVNGHDGKAVRTLCPGTRRARRRSPARRCSSIPVDPSGSVSHIGVLYGRTDPVAWACNAVLDHQVDSSSRCARSSGRIPRSCGRPRHPRPDGVEGDEETPVAAGVVKSEMSARAPTHKPRGGIRPGGGEGHRSGHRAPVPRADPLPATPTGRQ